MSNFDPEPLIGYAIAEQIPPGELASVVELQTKRLQAEMIGVAPQQWDQHQAIVWQMAIASPLFRYGVVMLAGADLIYRNAAAGESVVPEDPGRWGYQLWHLLTGDGDRHILHSVALKNSTVFTQWISQAVELWRAIG